MGHTMAQVLLLSMGWQAVDGKSLCVLRLVCLALHLLSTRRYENPLAICHTLLSLSNSHFWFLPLPKAEMNILMCSGFMSFPMVASFHHWWLNHMGNSIFLLSLGSFPGVWALFLHMMVLAVYWCQGQLSVVGSKTLYVYRSSVRSIRGGMTSLHFMSVSLNDSGHLCICKLGHFF